MVTAHVEHSRSVEITAPGLHVAVGIAGIRGQQRRTERVTEHPLGPLAADRALVVIGTERAWSRTRAGLEEIREHLQPRPWHAARRPVVPAPEIADLVHSDVDRILDRELSRVEVAHPP